MRDTFDDRITIATAHEELVMSFMNDMGWDCAKYGQGMQTERVRKILRLIDSNSRWLPDFVARERSSGRGLWIDAKTGLGTDYPNYSLEIRAFEAFVKWHDFDGGRFRCRYFWGDLHWCDVQTIAEGIANGDIRKGPKNRFGSGTPYYLVPKHKPYRSSKSLHDYAMTIQLPQKALNK